MNRLNLCFQGADGQWVPVSPDNPLPIATGSGPGAAVQAAPAVDDLPAKATAAQIASAFTELLASLRAAGVLRES
jgi:hypothetical protein